MAVRTTFPSTLPYALIEGYGISAAPSFRRIESGMGAPRFRLRDPKPAERVSVAWNLDAGEFATFRHWYESDSYMAGSRWFAIELDSGRADSSGMRELLTREAHFTKTWSAARVGERWHVTATLELRHIAAEPPTLRIIDALTIEDTRPTDIVDSLTIDDPRPGDAYDAGIVGIPGVPEQPSAGLPIALAATDGSVSGESATLTAEMSTVMLEATDASVSSETATLKLGKNLSATDASVSGESATLTDLKNLAATDASVSSESATLTVSSATNIIDAYTWDIAYEGGSLSGPNWPEEGSAATLTAIDQSAITARSTSGLTTSGIGAARENTAVAPNCQTSRDDQGYNLGNTTQLPSDTSDLHCRLLYKRGATPSANEWIFHSQVDGGQYIWLRHLSDTSDEVSITNTTDGGESINVTLTSLPTDDWVLIDIYYDKSNGSSNTEVTVWCNKVEFSTEGTGVTLFPGGVGADDFGLLGKRNCSDSALDDTYVLFLGFRNASSYNKTAHDADCDAIGLGA